MGGFGRIRKEIPGIVGLLHVCVGISLLRVDEIRELQRVANEKDRCVIANQIVIAIFSVKL